MKISMRWLAAGSLALAAGITPAFAQPAKTSTIILNPEITRRGEGTRRDELNKLELKAFDVKKWASLTDWQNGSALTEADTKGKVVLIVTYASWYKPSAQVVEAARKLAETYAKKDLIVLAVHDKGGWAGAEKTKAPEGAKFFLAHDSKNEFRKGLFASQDPEIYLIDRAGQVRFAGISQDTMEKGVKLLTDEKTEDAAKINTVLAEAQAKADAEKRKTTGAASHIDMRRIPELPFTPPSPLAYESAKWPLPPMNDEQRKKQRDTGELPPAKMAATPTEGWLPNPPKSNGRVMVYIFFHPDLLGSRFMDSIDRLSELQRGTRDTVFALALFDPRPFQWNGYPTDTKWEVDPDKLTGRIKEFLKVRKLDVPFVLDLDNALLNSIKFEGQDQWVGGMIGVVSSDGVMRWFGDGASWVGGGSGALERIVAVDPGVQARREAERKWLEANKETAKPADSSEKK